MTALMLCFSAAIGQRTVLAVSNRRGALRMADRVIVLKDGLIVDQGPLDTLLERCPEMRAIWEATAGDVSSRP